MGRIVGKKVDKVSVIDKELIEKKEKEKENRDIQTLQVATMGGVGCVGDCDSFGSSGVLLLLHRLPTHHPVAASTTKTDLSSVVAPTLHTSPGGGPSRLASSLRAIFGGRMLTPIAPIRSL